MGCSGFWSGRKRTRRCRDIFQGGDTGGVFVWGRDVGTNPQDGAVPAYFPTQVHATNHWEASEETGGLELGVPIIGGINDGIRFQGDRNIHHKEAEHGCAVYCDETYSGILWAVRWEAGGEGVPEVVGTGRSRFGGGGEEGSGSGRIGRRGDDRQKGGNAPRNNSRTVMRAGVQISNLTQKRDRV